MCNWTVTCHCSIFDVLLCLRMLQFIHWKIESLIDRFAVSFDWLILGSWMLHIELSQLVNQYKVSMFDDQPKFTEAIVWRANAWQTVLLKCLRWWLFSLARISTHHRRSEHESRWKRSKRHDAVLSCWSSYTNNPLVQGLLASDSPQSTFQNLDKRLNAFCGNI